MTTGNGTNATLDTVIIDTPNMATLARFYGDGLELGEASPTGNDHVGFRLPNAYFGFDLVESAPGEYPGPVSLWFEVDDVQTAFDRFVKLGAGVRYAPTRKPWGAVLAAVLDPDGNIVGLAQRGTVPSEGGEKDSV